MKSIASDNNRCNNNTMFSAVADAAAKLLIGSSESDAFCRFFLCCGIIVDLGLDYLYSDCDRLTACSLQLMDTCKKRSLILPTTAVLQLAAEILVFLQSDRGALAYQISDIFRRFPLAEKFAWKVNARNPIVLSEAINNHSHTLF